ncbi:MAG: prepilin-type N-terminal cleavage/methylation domain-containing protein [Clostridia bacterium]|nr:prepilin-type N-terminal cleavage/methylation domain-containing protein [Clostridia bacterium]NCC76661.1 prepilin-type N-terminal cleavage/methylation domain-containing protein [Clostridia bacterium]
MNRHSKGFTLIEIVIVISILAILTAIAIPSYLNSRNRAEQAVCITNRKTVARSYAARMLEDESSGITFDQFMVENFTEICPSGGVISNIEGKIQCSIHDDAPEVEDDPPEEVPWL